MHMNVSFTVKEENECRHLQSYSFPNVFKRVYCKIKKHIVALQSEILPMHT